MESESAMSGPHRLQRNIPFSDAYPSVSENRNSSLRQNQRRTTNSTSSEVEATQSRGRLNRLGEGRDISSRSIEDDFLFETLDDFEGEELAPENENNLAEQRNLLKNWDNTIRAMASQLEKQALHAIVQKIKAALQIKDSDKAAALFEDLRSEAGAFDIYLESDEISAEVLGSAEERKLFREDLKKFQDNFRKVISEDKILAESAKNTLLQDLDSASNSIDQMKNLENAKNRMGKAEESLKAKIEEARTGEKKSLKGEKLANVDQALQAMDRVLNLESDNAPSRRLGPGLSDSKLWGHEKAAVLAGKLKSYFSQMKQSIQEGSATPSDSDLRTYINSINKDEVNNIVQYVTGAIYEAVGKDESKWQQVMASSFSPALLGLMADRSGEEVGRLHSQEYFGLQGAMVYWTPSETINRLNALATNESLKKYFNPLERSETTE